MVSHGPPWTEGVSHAFLVVYSGLLHDRIAGMHYGLDLVAVKTADAIRGVMDLDLDTESYQNSCAKPKTRFEAFKKALWATVARWWIGKDLGVGAVESIERF